MYLYTGTILMGVKRGTQFTGTIVNKGANDCYTLEYDGERHVCYDVYILS